MRAPPFDAAGDGPAMSERLWRCAECGKWSHAKRDPKSHERFVQARFSEPDPPEDKIIRVVEDIQIAVDDFDPGGWFVRCGPFEPWVAEREAASRKEGPVSDERIEAAESDRNRLLRESEGR